MVTVNFSQPSIRVEEEGTFLCLRIAQSDIWKAKHFVFESRDVTYTAEIKEYRPKRSLDANSYFWTLLDELSKSVGVPKEEVYLRYVREFGPFRDFTLSEDEAKTFRTAWEKLGTGWPTEQVDYSQDGEKVIVRAYYGSSVYNTKQMSRLIDAVVQDCKHVGIETLTPDKIDLLKEDWRRGNTQGN